MNLAYSKQYPCFFLAFRSLLGLFGGLRTDRSPQVTKVIELRINIDAGN